METTLYVSDCIRSGAHTNFMRMYKSECGKNVLTAADVVLAYRKYFNADFVSGRPIGDGSSWSRSYIKFPDGESAILYKLTHEPCSGEMK